MKVRIAILAGLIIACILVPRTLKDYSEIPNESQALSAIMESYEQWAEHRNVQPSIEADGNQSDWSNKLFLRRPGELEFATDTSDIMDLQRKDSTTFVFHSESQETPVASDPIDSMQTAPATATADTEVEIAAVESPGVFDAFAGNALLFWTSPSTNQTQTVKLGTQLQTFIMESMRSFSADHMIGEGQFSTAQPKPAWHEWVDPRLILSTWAEMWTTETTAWADFWHTEPHATPVVLLSVSF